MMAHAHCHVVEVHRPKQEHAPILHQPMEVLDVLVPVLKASIATLSSVLVSPREQPFNQQKPLKKIA